MMCLECRYYIPKITHPKMNLIAPSPMLLNILTRGELALIKVYVSPP
jgi:hypothetical protein